MMITLVMIMTISMMLMIRMITSVIIMTVMLMIIYDDDSCHDYDY